MHDDIVDNDDDKIEESNMDDEPGADLLIWMKPPSLVVSVFDDFSPSKGFFLVRGDILNDNITKQEALVVSQALVSRYQNSDYFATVKRFNKLPDTFDFDDYLARSKARWVAVP